MDNEELYALHFITNTNRVAYAAPPDTATQNTPVVDSLPDGDITEYIYENGQLVYSPLPPDYPICEQDTEMDKVFKIGDEWYQAKTAIGKGEPVTSYNSEQISMLDALSILAEQKGE